MSTRARSLAAEDVLDEDDQLTFGLAVLSDINLEEHIVSSGATSFSLRRMLLAVRRPTTISCATVSSPRSRRTLTTRPPGARIRAASWTKSPRVLSSSSTAS